MMMVMNIIEHYENHDKDIDDDEVDDGGGDVDDDGGDGVDNVGISDE